jgi:hypothetical protein
MCLPGCAELFQHVQGLEPLIMGRAAVGQPTPCELGYTVDAYSAGAWDVPLGFQKQGGCWAAQGMCFALGTGLGESTRKLHSSALPPM